jgi:hypothetical protein
MSLLLVNSHASAHERAHFSPFYINLQREKHKSPADNESYVDVVVVDYDIEHECLFSENFDACVVERAGKDFLLLFTAGLKLYLTFACTKSSLNTLKMLMLFFAEHSTYPLSHSKRTMASFISA